MNKSSMTNVRVEEILAKRALKAAQTEYESDRDNIITSVAIVIVGQERFGIPMDGLAVICPTPPIAHLPMLPPAIRGIVQIRGEVIGAIDLARWFGISASEIGHLMAVIEGPHGKLGLLIDSVEGFKDITAEDLVDTFCDDSQATGHPVQFTTKDLVAIFSLAQLFSCREVAVDFSKNSAITKEGA